MSLSKHNFCMHRKCSPCRRWDCFSDTLHKNCDMWINVWIFVQTLFQTECVRSKTHICCMRTVPSNVSVGFSTRTHRLINSPLSKWEPPVSTMHCLLMENATHNRCGVVKISRSFAHDIHGAYAVVSLNRPHIISGYHPYSHSCEFHTFHVQTTTPVLRDRMYASIS